MQNDTKIFTFWANIGITIFILLLIYIFLGPPSYVELELINLLFYLVIIPLPLIGGTILICCLVGIPIRLIPNLKNFWEAKPYISVLVFVIGFILLLFSIKSENQTDREISLSWLLASGWFLISFSLVHFPYDTLISSIKKLNHHKAKNLTK